MKTVCHKQLHFESLFSKDVIADFDGGLITSDGGSLLLRELDKRYRVTQAITQCLQDKRCPERITHELLELFDLYIKAHPRQRSIIVLDIDSTDDPTHGKQQLSLFHGFYDQHMYHPLLVFDGLSGFPLAAVLRPGNAHAAHRAAALLKRLIKKLKAAYPGTPILLRGDAGFALPAIYQLCKQQGIHYTIGLITNDRLRGRTMELLSRAQQQFQLTGEKQRLFTCFAHRADSWQRHRRVIAKVECMVQGDNQRFVVTNLPTDAQTLYDTIYVQRGETENRIKELFTALLQSLAPDSA